ncbi:DNA damage-regulated autophagy modulator protein 2-like isoform X1 [Crassostrea virginica]
MMCLRGFCEGLSYLPLIMIVLTLETFILSYIFAVSRGDVNPYFPYISDTGTKVPESCVFGQFLNMAAVVALCTLYVRYKLVQSIVQSEEESVLKLNKVAFIFGILSPLGLSLVANFQETSVEKVHVTGATLVLGCGVVYEFLQTAISFKMHPTYNGLRICKIRLVISVISLIGFITKSTEGLQHALKAGSVLFYLGDLISRLQSGYTGNPRIGDTPLISPAPSRNGPPPLPFCASS